MLSLTSKLGLADWSTMISLRKTKVGSIVYYRLSLALNSVHDNASWLSFFLTKKWGITAQSLICHTFFQVFRLEWYVHKVAREPLSIIVTTNRTYGIMANGSSFFLPLHDWQLRVSESNRCQTTALSALGFRITLTGRCRRILFIKLHWRSSINCGSWRHNVRNIIH